VQQDQRNPSFSFVNPPNLASVSKRRPYGLPSL
jgi:hypothetical protein